MASSYANRNSLLEEGRRLTRPDEAPVAMTVFVLVDILVLNKVKDIDNIMQNLHCSDRRDQCSWIVFLHRCPSPLAYKSIVWGMEA